MKKLFLGLIVKGWGRGSFPADGGIPPSLRKLIKVAGQSTIKIISF